MEILEAFDKTGCAHSAAALVGCDPKTVRRVVARREAGLGVDALIVRPRLVDGFTGVVEQLVAGSEGVVRADVAHEKLVACGYVGSERTTRRAVAAAKAGWRVEHARSNRPWITVPGMWCQFDWGDGPKVWDLNGRLRSTVLFVAWVAWSRFRVVIPCWDQTSESLATCLDSMFRLVGGVSDYVLTDNAKTVTVRHIAGVPVRHPLMVDVGRHYGTTVHTCVPYDPQSKGGVESSVRVLIAEEIRGRDQATRTARRKQAGLPAGKTFHTWREPDSSIPPATQTGLASLEWIGRHENLAIAGPSGTGKTHFVEALAHKAIDNDLKVAWFTLESLTSQVTRANADGSIARTVARITRADLVVVDDIGMLPARQAAAEAFYRVVEAAYERRSVAVTSNIHPSGFDAIMPKTLATAAVDRLLHHAHVIITEGNSLRLSDAVAGRGVTPLT